MKPASDERLLDELADSGVGSAMPIDERDESSIPKPLSTKAHRQDGSGKHHGNSLVPVQPFSDGDQTLSNSSLLYSPSSPLSSLWRRSTGSKTIDETTIDPPTNVSQKESIWLGPSRRKRARQAMHLKISSIFRVALLSIGMYLLITFYMMSLASQKGNRNNEQVISRPHLGRYRIKSPRMACRHWPCGS